MELMLEEKGCLRPYGAYQDNQMGKVVEKRLLYTCKASFPEIEETYFKKGEGVYNGNYGLDHKESRYGLPVLVLHQMVSLRGIFASVLVLAPTMAEAMKEIRTSIMMAKPLRIGSKATMAASAP